VSENESMGDESQDEIRTVGWVDPTTAEWLELDVPVEMADKMAAGESTQTRRAEMRRFNAGDGIARLLARIDQLRARQDELLNEYPELKSHGPKRRPDQDD
jgi:hypothetical protein